MKKKYTIGIIISVVLLIGNQLLIQYYLFQKKGDEELIDKAGRQRMYSQKIAVQFYKYQQQQTSLSELEDTYKKWLAVNNAFLNGDESINIAAIEDEQLRLIAKGLSKKINYIGTKIDALKNGQPVDMDALIKNQTEFLIDMEVLVSSLDKMAEDKLTRIAITEILLALISIIIIALEVKYIYYPVAKDLATSNNELETALKLQKESEEEIKELLTITQNQNERLKNFAHIVSHNLRSHAGGMSSLLELYEMENPKVFEEEIFIHLKGASKNLMETVTHLNEIVEMTVLSSEAKVNTNLKQLVHQSMEAITGLAKNKQVTLQNNVSENFNVLAIPAYIDSIVLNFLTNGVKYSSPERDSFVKISAHEEGKYAVITFEDNGMGIDMQTDGEKLFGMYNTFHGNADAKGIGLFITKNQVENMGGRIEVQSEKNKGTTFKIFLPNEED